MRIRAALFLSLLFTFPILLIRAQPYDAGPLGEFFRLPAGCAAPCFLGVQPLQGDLKTAVDTLRSNDAIKSFALQTDFLFQYVELRWSAFPHAPSPFGFILRDGKIGWLIIPPTTSLGDIRLTLGEPQRISLATNGEYPPRAAYILEYPQLALHIFVGYPVCQVKRADFWQMRADGNLEGSFYVGFGVGDDLPQMTHPYVELSAQGWIRQIRAVCRP